MDLLALIGFLCFIYILIRVTVPWFLDCDLRLALSEKFGKPIYSLEGQVVWIIGASSGIGEHLAYVLARAKCKLILSARRGNELQMIKRKCIEEYRMPENDVEILELDICKIEHHQRMFNHVLTKFGKLDILVNNAGRSQRAEWENIELGVDKEMFNLNVFSIISLTRLVVKYFLQVGKGHVVVTSSLAGLVGAPFSATYTATKHALHGYFACLAMEKMNQNIDVTMVCPGPIQTNFLAECFTEKLDEKYGKQTEVTKEKVSAERCATLMAIAIANKLHEVWISRSLPIQLTYLARYYPDVSYYIFKILGPRFLQQLRDSKNISATNMPQPQNTTPS